MEEVLRDLRAVWEQLAKDVAQTYCRLLWRWHSRGRTYDSALPKEASCPEKLETWTVVVVSFHLFFMALYSLSKKVNTFQITQELNFLLQTPNKGLCVSSHCVGSAGGTGRPAILAECAGTLTHGSGEGAGAAFPSAPPRKEALGWACGWGGWPHGG